MLCSEGSLEACSKSIRLVSDQVGRGRVRVLELVTWEQRPKRWAAVSEAKKMGRRVTCPAATARLSVSLQLPNLSYPGDREQNHQFWSPYYPQYSCTAGVGRLLLRGQLWPATCFWMAGKLRMVSNSNCKPRIVAKFKPRYLNSKSVFIPLITLYYN